MPFLIFSSGVLLVAYALLIFFSIYYLVFSFICYGVKGDAQLVQAAEQLFNPWLTRLRLDEAKRQFREHPDWQIETIAQHCGFRTANYFHEVFKQKTGVTPTEWLERGEEA